MPIDPYLPFKPAPPKNGGTIEVGSFGEGTDETVAHPDESQKPAALTTTEAEPKK
jgi:hypothetical protein